MSQTTLAEQKNKFEIAKRAALSYFGFSKRLDRFQNVKINFYDGSKNKQDLVNDNFLIVLDRAIKDKWEDEIGSLSKTARMSLHDFAFYVNELRRSKRMNLLSVKVPNDRGILVRWMRVIAELNEPIVLVELEHNNKQKFLLVNTDITFNEVRK